MSKKKVTVSNLETLATVVELQPVANPTPAKKVFVKEPNRISPKITMGQRIILDALFLQKKANETDELEVELSQLTLNLFKSTAAQAAIAELKQKGYVDENGEITAYGDKICMVGTSPTPNLQRIADGDIGAAFKMLTVAGTALVDKHNILKNGIRPGKTSDLCDALDKVAYDIIESLEIGGYYPSAE
jgi:hypothetical protein